MTRRAWLKLLADNRRTIFSLAREGFATWRRSRRAPEPEEVASAAAASWGAD